MGHSACKQGVKDGFYILWQGDGIRRRVKRAEWANLGLGNCKTREEAAEVCKYLNARGREDGKKNRIAARIERTKQTEHANFPLTYLVEFEKLIEGRREGARDICRWESAKSAAFTVNVNLKDWWLYKDGFHNYFISQKYSMDYSTRLLRFLNEWGEFVAYRTNVFYKKIPAPTGSKANEIRAAHNKAVGRSHKSKRIGFELIEAKKKALGSKVYNWLFAARAFGLRPDEMYVSLQSLQNPKLWAVTHKGEETFLHVYQPKLERFEPKQRLRWKKIPVKLPEQKKALLLLQAGDFFKGPAHGLRKILREVLGEGFTPYGPRKDFYPVMGAVYEKATVSKWMGHRRLETAYRHYDDPGDDAPFADSGEQAA